MSSRLGALVAAPRHEDLRRAFLATRIFQMSDLEWGELLGEGMRRCMQGPLRAFCSRSPAGFFGRVYKARHRRTGKDVVIKELKER